MQINVKLKWKTREKYCIIIRTAAPQYNKEVSIVMMAVSCIYVASARSADVVVGGMSTRFGSTNIGGNERVLWN